MNPLLQHGLDGAFVADGFGALSFAPETNHAPRLSGVRLAVKDVFAVAGLTCSAGNPCWLRDQAVAPRSALVVDLLLGEGCSWVGKTVTDELTYSLAGINAHYGTPLNPAAPRYLPGGSSSGSAVAVAGGYADLSLGTDCGGSVRLPASYCGVWGIRPTHGRVAAGGCFTLAQSFDTVGWFARDADILGKALECVMHSRLHELCNRQPRLLVSDDVLALLDIPVRMAFERWLMEEAIPHERLCVGTLPLSDWARAFRTLQAAEVWQQHGSWVRRSMPAFGPDIGERFAVASRVTPEQVSAAAQVRSHAQRALAQLLGNDLLMLLPPVPGTAPRLDAPVEQINDTRTRSQELLCIAGLAGLPQVVMPWQRSEGAPVGMSLIGARFADESVLEAARLMHHRHVLKSSRKC